MNIQIENQGKPEEQSLPPLNFNLMRLEPLRKHFHKMGNDASREMAISSNEKRKAILMKERDYYKSIANYLDIADHIKMSEL